MSAPDTGRPDIQTEDGERRVSIVLHGRQYDAYPITEAELDNLSSPSGPINLAMLGITIGAAVSLGTTRYTVPMPPEKTGFFGAAFCAACIAVLYFTVMVLIGVVTQRRQIKEIKKRPNVPN